MMDTEIIVCQIPPSLILHSLPQIDHQDAFFSIFSNEHSKTIDSAFHAFFNSAPNWVHNLFALRNSLAKKIGLKTPMEPRKEFVLKNFIPEIGQRIGIFEVFDKNENEILLGENDKHLNFRNSILLELVGTNTYKLTLSTIVQYHSGFGKAYFSIVNPFHKLIVKAMMKNMIKDLSR